MAQAVKIRQIEIGNDRKGKAAKKRIKKEEGRIKKEEGRIKKKIEIGVGGKGKTRIIINGGSIKETS